MLVDMRGITRARTGLETTGGKKSTEEWFRISCDVALAFGAKLNPEAHGGVRAEFPGDRNSPSLVIWSTGHWYDHRGEAKGGTLELREHLQARGLTQIGNGPALDDAAFRALWSRSFGTRRTYDPSAGQARWDQLSWAPGDQQESTLSYFRYRGLRTDWCSADTIRTRNLQPTYGEIEKQHQELGADFLFAVSYYPFERFLPARQRDPHWDRIAGMQRTFLAHPVDEYHPVRKTGRAMLGPAGMSRIVVPSPTIGPDAPITADYLALAALAPDASKRLFYSEGLESGLSVAQIAGGILHCLWSTAGYKALANAVLDSEGAILPDDSDSVHILLVDRDPSRAGENAAIYLYHTLRLVGRRVLFLLPPKPEGVDEWSGDWNDVLLEGRMAQATPQAIAHSTVNAQDAPIVPEPGLGYERIERIERPKTFRSIQDVRAHIEMRGYRKRHLDKEDALGGDLCIDTTGSGKTSHLARLQPPAWAQKTCVATPQRRDAKRIASKNAENQGEFFPRNSRTNTMAREDDTAAIIADAVEQAQHLLWTNDSNYRVSRQDFIYALQHHSLPACYRNQLQFLTITENGVASFAKGETHPDQLAAQRQGVRPECTRCPHGKVADIHYRAEQKPKEADEILMELDQVETYRASYFEENAESATIQSAPLKFFAPCPAELNRRFSYKENVVCTTTQCLDKDKRLFGQVENIHQDEEPALTESITITQKKLHEFGRAVHRAIHRIHKKLDSPKTEAPEKKRLKKELEGAQLTLQMAAFLGEHFFGVTTKHAPEDMHQLIESDEVQQTIVQPFVAWATKNIEHQAPFEAPYAADENDPQSFRYIPPVITRALADSLHYGSFRFVFREQEDGDATPEMVCCYPTSFGLMVASHKKSVLKKSLTIYSATPSKVLYESLPRDENYADDHVHLELIPHTHYKAAFRKDQIADTKSAWDEIWSFWEQGLKVAFLADKKRALALRKIAKRKKPEWEYLIGWIGKHHIAHDDWADCDGLVIWSLDLPSIQVLAQEMAFQKRIFEMNWQDVDLYQNYWENASTQDVEFPYLGLKVPMVVFDHPDLDVYIRFRVSQIITQAIGRLRGVNGGAGKFCRVYSAIAPVDGLFGTFIDAIPDVAQPTNEFLHKQHVCKVAQAIARTLVLPDAETLGQSSLLDAVVEKRLTVREIQEIAKQHHVGFQAKHLREILDAVVSHLPNVQGYDIRKQGTRVYLRPVPTLDLPVGAGDGAEKRLWLVLEQLRRELRPGTCITLRPQDLLYAEGTFGATSYTAYQRMLRQVGKPLLDEVLARFAASYDLHYGYGADLDLLTPTVWLALPEASATNSAQASATAEEKGMQKQGDARVVAPLNTTRGGPQHTRRPVPAWIRTALLGADAQHLATPAYTPTDQQDARCINRLATVTLFPDALTGSRMLAHAGGAPRLERLLADPEDRVFPTFIASDYPLVLARVTRNLERRRFGRRWADTPEFADAIQYRVGLEYRRQWAQIHRETSSFYSNTLLGSLDVLVDYVDRYLTGNPECLDITQALLAAKDDLRDECAVDPMIAILLDDWFDNPVLPRLDLTKPLYSVRMYPKEVA
jgi:hypothetical protein